MKFKVLNDFGCDLLDGYELVNTENTNHQTIKIPIIGLKTFKKGQEFEFLRIFQEDGFDFLDIEFGDGRVLMNVEKANVKIHD